MRLPFAPPLAPMLSRAADALPGGDGWQFEPKWDGFRTIMFRDGDEVLLQSRDEKPMNRYFPELVAPLAAALPARCVVDGEIVIVGADGLDFEALLLRIHPAASRVKLLAAESPASFVAWDLLALGDEDLRGAALAVRRERLEQALGGAAKPVHLSPATRDRALAEEWFRRFEGAGLDGVMAKRLDEPYRAGERTMIKVKHARTADCVVAGFRWHKKGAGAMVGSLLLGLYDEEGTLHHVGVTAAFSNAVRRALVAELAPLRENALQGHPWHDWADAQDEASARGQRMPGASSRWNRGKDLSWAAFRQITALAALRRFRVEADAEGFPFIPGTRGRIGWTGGAELAVYTTRRWLFCRLWAIPGVRRHQTGDTEMRALFPPALLEPAAAVIRARRRRILTQDDARAIGARTAYSSTSSPQHRRSRSGRGIGRGSGQTPGSRARSATHPAASCQAGTHSAPWRGYAPDGAEPHHAHGLTPDPARD